MVSRAPQLVIRRPSPPLSSPPSPSLSSTPSLWASLLTSSDLFPLPPSQPTHFGAARDDLHNAKVHAKKSWFSFGDAAGEATRGVGEATQNQAARAQDAAHAGYEQARDTASNAYDSARDTASNAYSSARDAAHHAGSRVQDAYGSSVETIGEKVRGAGERLESHGSDVRPVEQKAGWKPW